MIDSYESKNALASGDTVLSSIALYIPPNSLQYSHGANYEGLDQGALFAAAGAKVQLTTMLGNDQNKNFVVNKLKELNVKLNFFKETDRPTTTKKVIINKCNFKNKGRANIQRQTVNKSLNLLIKLIKLDS